MFTSNENNSVYYIERASSSESLIVGHSRTEIGLYECERDGSQTTILGWEGIIANHVAFSPTNNLAYLAAGNGVLVTNDNFKSFKITTGWQVSEVQYIHVLSTNPNIVIAATASGIWRSEDAGKTWKAASTGLRLPGSKYVTSLIEDFTHKKLFAVTADGIKLSLNKGISWRNFAFTGKEVLSLAIDPLNKEHMMACTDHEIYSSEDGGKSWQSRYTSKKSLLGIAYHKNNSTCYAFGMHCGIITSTDDGKSWKKMNNELANKSVLYIATEGATLYAGVDGGLWYSDNNGVNFKCISSCDGRVSFVQLR